jgi:hypothetical protein
MKLSRTKKSYLPDFSHKVLSVSIAGEDDGRCLEHPEWEMQGGRLFLVGTVPLNASRNDWCGGVPSAVAWNQVTDYLVFNSAKHYAKSLRRYYRNKQKRKK